MRSSSSSSAAPASAQSIQGRLDRSRPDCRSASPRRAGAPSRSRSSPGSPSGSMAQAVDQVVANACRETGSARRPHRRDGVRRRLSGRSARLRSPIWTSPAYSVVRRADDAREGAGRRAAVGRRCPTRAGSGQVERDAVDDRRRHAGRVTLQVLDHERAGERLVVALRQRPPRRRQEPLRREMLDDLVVLDLHVEALLVPVDQLLQRRRQLAIGGDHGDELADVEAAAQREIAADRVEEERRHLRQQVVQELDHELPLVDAEADVEELEQAAGRSRPAPMLSALWTWTASMPSTTSPTRPARRREAIWRCLPSRRSSRRSRGMIGELDADDARRHQAEPEVLDHDEDERGQRPACRGRPAG